MTTSCPAALLKNAFEAFLAVHVYPVPSTSRDWLAFEYKGLRLEMGAADRELMRRAQLKALADVIHPFPAFNRVLGKILGELAAQVA